MVTISPEAHALAISSVDLPLDAETRRLTTRVRTEVNDPSVQLLLAELVVRLERIEELLVARTSAEPRAAKKSTDKQRKLQHA
jgi:hypothetical protein